VASAKPKPVAYFLVDAMRFEMGVELAERLPKASEVAVRAAVGALPSITPIGMAALMPGASSSFSVVEEKDKLGARIDDAFLPDLAARKKHATARVPKLVDLALDELLSLQPSKLAKKVEGAQVVLVRSQEIDHAGETGFTFQARQVMDSVIDNLKLAISKLAKAGVEHAVVSADHGHLFFANDRDESMRTDAPGGDTVELHRRCWIGRGGATSAGCVRVSATQLGYASDLELVFPAATGIFKAGGDLAFHHGGPALQEMVIPVLTVRTKTRDSVRPSAGPMEASGLPEAVTNRIFSVTFIYGAKQMLLGATGIQVRPLLMAAGKQVGAVGMAVDAQFDRATGTVKLEPNKPVTIAFLLSDESAASLRVVVQDPTTDAELYRSPTDIPVRLGV
jgi:PglZ domain-containing protein